jgi:hypothetical protein
MSPKRTAAAKDLPLETDSSIFVDPVTGHSIRLTTHRRGILTKEIRHYAWNQIRARRRSSAKSEIEALREELRGELKCLGLPSDRIHYWTRVGDEVWRPQTRADLSQADRDSARWIAVVKEETEPLSKGRLAGELLWLLNQTLDRPEVDEGLLREMLTLMDAYLVYAVCGDISKLATSGIASAKGRQAGPAAKRERAAKSRQIIFKRAQEYWLAQPLYRGDADNTAAQIKDSVNEQLRSANLLPAGRALSRKTIADHIRAGAGGKHRRVRQSRIRTGQSRN